MIQRAVFSIVVLLFLFPSFSWSVEAGFVFSRTDKEEYRWIDTNDSGQLGSAWINEECAARLGGSQVSGDWFDLITLAPGFDTITAPCDNPPVSEPGYVFSRSDKEEYRWIDTNDAGQLGSTWIDQECAERLGGAKATGDWSDLIALAPGFDTITAPCDNPPANDPGFVFSRSDKEEYRWINTNDAGQLGSVWIDKACADRFGGATATGNWQDLIELAPGFDTIASPCDDLTPPPPPPIPQLQGSLELVPDKIFRISWQPAESALFYRVLENPDGVSGFTPVSEDLDAPTQSFDHRVALYARVNASYIIQACNDGGCVDSDELFVSGSLASAIGYFKASNTDPEDSFGIAISLSADGDTLAIGARGEASSATGVNGNEDDNSAASRNRYGAGAVYVFARINGTWQQQAYLKATVTDSGDLFGGAVSLSADGNTLAIGANGGVGYDGNSVALFANGRAAVYVFIRSNGSWEQQANLDFSLEVFGWAVSLSADGDTLAVGAIGDSSGSTEINGDRLDRNSPFTGAVYVYARSNGNWEEQAYLKAGNSNITEQGIFFGDAVSLSANGNTLAVGASNQDDTGPHSGAAYIFVRSNENWQQQAYLKASNHVAFIVFGRAVSLSADGNTVAVGAPRQGANSGAVYVYTRSNEDWQEQAYLKASNEGAYDLFGSAVSLSADGNNLAVGAPDEESAATGINGNQDNFGVKTGAVYVFEHSNGDWQQKAYVKASNTDPADVVSNGLEDFGAAVSLSADGNTLAVGANGEDSAATGVNGNQGDNSAPRAGAAYLY